MTAQELRPADEPVPVLSRMMGVDEGKHRAALAVRVGLAASRAGRSSPPAPSSASHLVGYQRFNGALTPTRKGLESVYIRSSIPITEPSLLLSAGERPSDRRLARIVPIEQVRSLRMRSGRLHTRQGRVVVRDPFDENKAEQVEAKVPRTHATS